MIDLMAKLTEAIPVDEISWKPQVIKDGKALMVAYVDARWVAQRLDDATDGGWSFVVTVLDANPDRVVIKGSLSIGTELREDVGEYKKQRDTDDIEMYKAAVSDAFKRSAVMFGVGRELYSLPITWVDWDMQKKRPAPGAMDKLDALVARGRKAQPEPEHTPEPEARKVDLAPLGALIDKLNAAFHMDYNPGQVVVSIYGGNIPEDLNTIKPEIVRWYRAAAVREIAKTEDSEGYNVDDVLFFVDKKVPGHTYADLPKQYAAMIEYFKGE